MAEQGSADEQHRILAVVAAQIRQARIAHAAGGAGPRRLEPPQRLPEAGLDRETLVAGECETPTVIRKDGDVGSGQAEQGAEQHLVGDAVIGMAHEPAAQTRVRHHHEVVTLGRRAHRFESQHHRTHQHSGEPLERHEIEVALELVPGGREVREVQAAPTGLFVRLLHRAPAGSDAAAERDEVVDQVLVILDEVPTPQCERLRDRRESLDRETLWLQRGREQRASVHAEELAQPRYPVAWPPIPREQVVGQLEVDQSHPRQDGGVAEQHIEQLRQMQVSQPGGVADGCIRAAVIVLVRRQALDSADDMLEHVRVADQRFRQLDRLLIGDLPRRPLRLSPRRS